MIRTEPVKLTVIPAIAYRQKLQAGGAGITILRADTRQPGIASISKTSGEAIPAANTPRDAYPDEAFAEAIGLTARMPYRKRGSLRVTADMFPVEEAPAEPDAPEEEVVIDSGEYQRVVDAYTDSQGRLSYELLNRDLIQAAHQSRHIQEMIARGDAVDVIRLTVIRGRFAAITGNYDLTDAQLLAMVELLDEVSPKGVLTELNREIRRWLAT